MRLPGLKVIEPDGLHFAPIFRNIQSESCTSAD